MDMARNQLTRSRGGEQVILFLRLFALTAPPRVLYCSVQATGGTVGI